MDQIIKAERENWIECDEMLNPVYEDYDFYDTCIECGNYSIPNDVVCHECNVEKCFKFLELSIQLESWIQEEREDDEDI